MRALLALLVGLGPAQAGAIDYRWVVGTGQGNVEASIKNRAGSNLIVFCGSGTDEKGGGIILEGLIAKAGKAEPVDVQVVVDDRSFVFSMTDGYGPTQARGARQQLGDLARALVASRASAFTVEYPKLGQSERFSLRDARDALGEGRGTIVDSCL